MKRSLIVFLIFISLNTKIFGADVVENQQDVNFYVLCSNVETNLINIGELDKAGSELRQIELNNPINTTKQKICISKSYYLLGLQYKVKGNLELAKKYLTIAKQWYSKNALATQLLQEIASKRLHSAHTFGMDY